MSAAMRSPLDGREAQSRSAVAVELSADNAWFDDDAMLETETLILAAGVPLASIRTARFYQFSFVPDPHIFLTIVLPLAGTFATGAVLTPLCAAVNSLFRPRSTPPHGR